MADEIDFSKCPTGIVVSEKLDNMHGDIKDIKDGVKEQNGRVRTLELDKADKSELKSIWKKLDENSNATLKIITAASTAIALISIALLAYQTFNQ